MQHARGKAELVSAAAVLITHWHFRDSATCIRGGQPADLSKDRVFHIISAAIGVACIGKQISRRLEYPGGGPQVNIKYTIECNRAELQLLRGLMSDCTSLGL
jgi:hypothetical protein